jgi:hypothetical protein
VGELLQLSHLRRFETESCASGAERERRMPLRLEDRILRTGPVGMEHVHFHNASLTEDKMASLR